jgi:hypothetical protein
MPSGRATSTIARVMSMSAREGVGSPEGWLCPTYGARYRIDMSKCFHSQALVGAGIGGGKGFRFFNITLRHVASRTANI